MRICILTEYLTYIGGGERVYCNWANMFAKELGCDVTILSLEDANSTFYELVPEVKIESLHLRKEGYYRTRFMRKFQTILFVWYDIYKIKRYLVEMNFDVVIGITTNMSLLLSLIKCKGLRIGTEHTEYNGCAYYLRWLREKTYPKLNMLTVLTQNDKLCFDRFMHDVYVMPNPLSISPSSLANLNNRKLITIGSLSPQKNHLVMIEIFKRVSIMHPEWTLDIYGEGIMRALLDEKINEMDLTDKVFLKGTTHNVIDVLKDASIFILTSKIEGFGLVLIEAMACGIPCVSFKNPGPAEIICNGRNGFLIENGNVDEFALVVSELIENERIRKIVGMNASLSVDRYKPDCIKEKWIQLLHLHSR